MIRNRPILLYALRLVLLAFAIVNAFQLGIAGAHLILRLQQPVVTSTSAMNPVQQLASVFTPEVLHWTPLIDAWATAYNVDPNLIATVIQIESCGNPYAVSPSGAQGLFQVMPSHFNSGEDMLEVLTNGRRGMEYLAKALQIAAGDPGLALAGYNGGVNVSSAGWAHWPAETRRYYQWGIGIYDDASKGHSVSQVIQDWLKAGGERLCQKASQEQLIAQR